MFIRPHFKRNINVFREDEKIILDRSPLQRYTITFNFNYKFKFNGNNNPKIVAN